MIRSLVGRVVASVGATALAVGVGVVAGAGTSSAADTLCGSSEGFRPAYVTEAVENTEVLRTWEGESRGFCDAVASVKGTVEFDTRVRAVAGEDQFVTRITNHGPAGFEYVSASLMYRDAAGAYYGETVTPEVSAGTVTYRAPGAGWLLDSGGHWSVVLRVTYRAPMGTIPFSRVDGGGVTFDVVGIGENLGSPTMGPDVSINLPIFGS